MRDIRDTFIEIIPKQSWMDKNSQTKAAEKVDYDHRPPLASS